MSFLASLRQSTSPYSIQGQQLLNLLILLVIGKVFLDLHVAWSTVIVVVIIAILIEHILLYLRDGALRFFSVSSVLTALGLLFMIHADMIVIYAVLLSLAFVQKYVLRVHGHHVFNPSNLAVTLALLLFPQHTYVEMWQWGQHLWLGLLLFLLGFAILWRVKRVWIPLVFLVIYIPLQIYLFAQHGTYPLDFLWTRLFSGGFLIYSIFMLTDPRTTPEKTSWQIFFITLVALTATALDKIFGMVTAHLFWALTLISALVPLMRLWSKEDTVQNDHRHRRQTWAISLGLFTMLLVAIVFYSLLQ